MGEKVPIREGIFTMGHDGTALLGCKCKSCGQAYFPKVHFCLNCYQEELEDVILSRTGELYSYTVVHMSSSHFEAPYAVGYVDLPDNVRILAPLEVLDNKPFKVGMQVELRVVTLWRKEGKEIVGYRFSPVYC